MLKRISSIKVLETTDGNVSSAFTSLLHSKGIHFDLYVRDLHHNNGFDTASYLDGNAPKMQYEIFVSKEDENNAIAVMQKIRAEENK